MRTASPVRTDCCFGPLVPEDVAPLLVDMPARYDAETGLIDIVDESELAGVPDPLAEYKRRGFKIGVPDFISWEMVEVDLKVYRRMKCEVCHARRLRVTPMHRGDIYILACVCQVCSAVEEC